MESATRSQRAITHGESEMKIHEITQTLSRDNLQQQAQTDSLRKQLQSLLEKEKVYKQEISDLKQQLSRRYFSVSRLPLTEHRAFSMMAHICNWGLKLIDIWRMLVFYI